MKKVFNLSLVVLILASLFVGCSDTEDESGSESAVDGGVNYLNNSFTAFTFGAEDTTWTKDGNWIKFNCNDDSKKEKAMSIYYPEKIDGGFSVKLKKTSGYEKAGYGVIFAAKDKENYYRFLLTTSENKGVKTSKIINGTTTDVTDWLSCKSLKSGNSENTITVRKENSNYAIYVNDEFVSIIEEPELTEGYAGFYASVSTSDTPSTSPVTAYFKFTELDSDNISIFDGGMNYKTCSSSGISNLYFAASPYWSKLTNGWTRFNCAESGASTGGYWALYPQESVSGFTMKVKKESGNAGGAYGAYFCLQDSKNYYQFNISTNKGMYQVKKNINGTASTLQVWIESSVIKKGYNAENTLSLAKKDGNYVLSINGTKVYTIENPELGDGYAGFRSAVTEKDNPATTPVINYHKFTSVSSN
ncbi:MAG: hypothetical protein K5873_02690 [Treponema sp.]|nr:hypothetical protein [Treponema sp.]